MLRKKEGEGFHGFSHAVCHDSPTRNPAAFLALEVCLPLSLGKRYNNSLNKKALQRADASLTIAFHIAKSRP